MDWRSLLTNRWALGGVAVAAGAGGYVLYRKNKTGGSSQSGGGAGAQATPSYASGAVGSFDSTGTDVANWLGNYSQNLDNQFKEFQKNVAAQLATIPAAPTGTGGQTTANNPATPAPAAAGPAPLPTTLTAPANTNLYNWSQQIEQQYGLTTPLFSVLSGYRWGSPSQFGADPQYGNVPYFTAPTTVRLG